MLSSSPLLYQHCPNHVKLLCPITVKLSSLFLQSSCPENGTASCVVLLSKRSWWQKISRLYLCNWTAGVYSLCIYCLLTLLLGKKKSPTFTLVIDRLCYRKCQAGCAMISNKCSHIVFLWECKLPVPSLSTTWPAVPFSKAFWGSIFSWRGGGKGSRQFAFSTG